MKRSSIALFLATAGLIAGVSGCAQTTPASRTKGDEKPTPASSAPAHSQPASDKESKNNEGGEGGEG